MPVLHLLCEVSSESPLAVLVELPHSQIFIIVGQAVAPGINEWPRSVTTSCLLPNRLLAFIGRWLLSTATDVVVVDVRGVALAEESI